MRFNRIDKNKSGFIGANELKAYYQNRNNSDDLESLVRLATENSGRINLL